MGAEPNDRKKEPTSLHCPGWNSKKDDRPQMTEAADKTPQHNLTEYKASIVNNKMCVLQFNVQVSLLIATVPNLKI